MIDLSDWCFRCMVCAQLMQKKNTSKTVIEEIIILIRIIIIKIYSALSLRQALSGQLFIAICQELGATGHPQKTWLETCHSHWCSTQWTTEKGTQWETAVSEKTETTGCQHSSFSLQNSSSVWKPVFWESISTIINKLINTDYTTISTHLTLCRRITNDDKLSIFKRCDPPCRVYSHRQVEIWPNWEDDRLLQQPAAKIIIILYIFFVLPVPLLSTRASVQQEPDYQALHTYCCHCRWIETLSCRLATLTGESH